MESEQVLEPVSPTGQYLNSSVLSLCVLAVLETELPVQDSNFATLVKDIFLPINPRFSSIMVADKNGKHWKKVEVNIKDHIRIPRFPEGKSLEFYDKYFEDYLSEIALDQLPQSRPLWEIHIIKYPTSNAAGCFIFKLHHALGDGYSLMGALLSCLQRADDPSIPLTFPAKQSISKEEDMNGSVFKRMSAVLSLALNTVMDFVWSVMKSSFLEDGQTPIRSGDDNGLRFQPITVTTLTFSLGRIKQIKSKLNVTVNDVIAGVIFLGTRLYMQTASPELGNAEATALVLLNTRAVGGYNYKHLKEMLKPNAEMPWGNHFAFLHVSIPKLTHFESSNPLSFVMKAHQIIKKKRDSAAIYLTGKLLDILRKFRGAEATAGYIYKTVRNCSVVLTNVIGPTEQMALASQPVKGLYGITITMVSYMDNLRVAICSKKGLVDPHRFKACIEEAFDMILNASNQLYPQKFLEFM
ncbi:hypothetical protein NMG60_11035609 [Bertholletia excelsa]